MCAKNKTKPKNQKPKTKKQHANGPKPKLNCSVLYVCMRACDTHGDDDDDDDDIYDDDDKDDDDDDGDDDDDRHVS